jgi:hypothetical protein
VPYRRG